MFPLAEKLRAHLLDNIPSAKSVSGGDSIAMRCPDCGDSRKHASSRHMYVSMPTEKDPGLYYCHLCHSSGIVTHRKLLDWGCYDPELAEELYLHNQKVSGSTKYKKYSIGRSYHVTNSMIKNDDLSIAKMSYINNRLGTSLKPADFLSLKVVINLLDLLEENNITQLTRDYSIVEQLDRSFVGFLSLDNGFVTLRKTDDEPVYDAINMRYVNYKLFDKEDTSERFYVVPQAIDLLAPGRIKLHVAEGVFDVLSIYLNLRRGEPGIYASVSGSNYSSVISYFMMEKMIPNLEVHLYPDNDQPEYRINKIVRDFDSMRAPIYIHRNTAPGEKDFGVSLDRINEVVRKANMWV